MRYINKKVSEIPVDERLVSAPIQRRLQPKPDVDELSSLFVHDVFASVVVGVLFEGDYVDQSETVAVDVVVVVVAVVDEHENGNRKRFAAGMST